MKRILSKGLTLVVMTALIITVFSLVGNKGNHINAAQSNTIYKNTSLYDITGTNHTSNQNVISISEVNANQNVDYSMKTISIASAMELSTFSTLCNSNDKFLSYHYVLNANIRTSNANRFAPVGWSTPFSGTFDGQGHEITGLSFKVFETADAEDYTGIEYIAMFSQNTGTIKNLGLINTDQVQRNSYDSILGISPFVGVNDGTIENCFVRDLRYPELEEAGITALGGYRISGFVSHNNATISNSYVAYSIVVNYTIIDYIDFRPIATTIGVDSNIKNTYFYDASIVSETNSSYIYDNGLLGGIAIEKSNVFGERASTISDLNTKFLSIIAEETSQGKTSAWYVDNMYQKYNLNLRYPSLQGLEEIQIQYESESIVALNIKNAYDFASIFKLANNNSYFASINVTYYISEDIDLSLIPASSYAYTDFFSSRIIGNSNDKGSILTSLGETSISLGVTIYNFSTSNVVSYSGYECYGLFPLFDGTIQNLNFYNKQTITNFNPYSSTTPTKAIGYVCGINEGGTIENVRTYSNMQFSSGMGRYYAGGLCGIAARGAVIKNTTTAGTIVGALDSISSVSFNSTMAGYTSGVSLGGIVGFVEANCDSLKDLLSATSLTSSSYSNISSLSYVGGIVGSGYFNEVDGLFYKGSIFATDTTSSIMEYYIAGNIGGVLGVKNSLLNLHNQGNITVNISSRYPSVYISGCINTMLDSSSRLTTFYGSNLSNGGILSFTNSASTISNLAHITGVAYIKSSLGFSSVLTGIYNVDYSFTSNYAPSQNKTKQSIDVSSLASYAGCVNTDSNNTVNSLTLTKAYNLRDVIFFTSKNQISYSSQIKISGVVLGGNVTLKDVRNEGDMTFNINHNFTASNFIVMGVFEEVSAGFSAQSIYNGGDIKFLLTGVSTTNVTFNLFISGICYKNVEGTYNAQNNPLSSNYDNSLIGSLDMVINNGAIESNAQSVINLARGTENQNSTLNISANTAVTSTIKGSVRISGICMVNEFIITNAFNLGDINNFGAMTSNYSLESAGISWLNAGRYAQIRDCANNGTIKTVNMSSNTSFVHSSGISVRNDLTKSLGNYNNSGSYHHQQLICFTINYGEIYAFNYVNNVLSSNEAHSKVAGVLSVGLCSILNTVNYANIYGSEIAGGIFGYVVFSKYSTEVSNSSKVNLANSINYGNLTAIVKTIRSETNYYIMGYAELRELDSTKTNYFQLVTVENRQYVGAILAVINYATSTNAVNINIRYLINFDTNASIVGSEINIPSGITTDNSTLVSTKVGDSFMSKSVVFAPLSTVSDEDGNIGVFSPDFAFRKMVEGKLDLVEETDKFIPDYFQFVGFTKINTSLIESIGWRTIAYANAAEGFAKNMEKFSVLLDNYQTANSSGYQTVLNQAFENLTWINNADATVLKDTLEKMTENYDTTKLKEIIKYLFVENSNSSIITSELRSVVVEILLNSLDTTTQNLTNILDAMMIDSLMAELIAKSDTEYTNIQNVIQGNISNLSYQQLKSLAEQYINMLSDNTIAYTEFFSNVDLLQSRQTLLISLLNGLPEGIYQELYNIIDTTDYDAAGELAAILNDSTIGTDDVKKSIYTGVLTNNSSREIVFDNSVKRILRRMRLEEYEMSTTVTNAYKNNISSSDYTNVWNSIKNNSSVQKYLSDNLGSVTNVETGSVSKGIYAKATEFRNSYQSNDSPVTITSNNSGRLRGESGGNSVDTRFIYVEDQYVSDLTYYYGPYQNTNGDKWIMNERLGWDLSDNSNAGASSGNATQRYVPVFISLNKEFLEEKIASKENKTAYLFYWNNVLSGSGVDRSSARSQYVYSGIYSTSSKSDLHAPLLKNTKLETSSKFYNLGYDLDAAVGYTYNTERDWTGNALANNANDETIASAISNYMKFYISASLNTGVYYQQDQWINVVSYLTAKSGNYATGYRDGTTTYRGVITTSYIDYTISDLVNVDGVKTKGSCDSSIALDEVEIINRVMNVLLQDNAGISTVLAAIGSFGTQTDITASNSTAYYNVMLPYLIAMGNNQSFVNDYVLNMAYDSETHSNLFVNASTTIEDYIRSLKTDDFSLYDRLILYSISSKNNYQTILEYILNSTDGYYEYLKQSGVYSILTSRYNNAELEYISNMIEFALSMGDMTNTELKEMLLGIDMSKIEGFIDSIPSSTIEISNLDLNSSVFTLSENFSASILADSNYPYALTALDDTASISFTVSTAGVDLTLDGLTGAYVLYKDTTMITNLMNLEAGDYRLVLSKDTTLTNITFGAASLVDDLYKLGDIFDAKTNIWTYFTKNYSEYSSNLLDQIVISAVDNRVDIHQSNNTSRATNKEMTYSFAASSTGLVNNDKIVEDLTINGMQFSVVSIVSTGDDIEQRTNYIRLPKKQTNAYSTGFSFTLGQNSTLVIEASSTGASNTSSFVLLDSSQNIYDTERSVTGSNAVTFTFENVPMGTYYLMGNSTERGTNFHSMTISYTDGESANELSFELSTSGTVYIDLTTTTTGQISISNATRAYIQNITADTSTYIFKLSGGQYKLTYPMSGVILNKVSSVLDIDQQAIIDANHSKYSSLKDIDFTGYGDSTTDAYTFYESMQKYLTFESIQKNISSNDLTETHYKNIYSQIISNLYGVEESSDLLIKEFTDKQKLELIKLLCIKDNTSLLDLITRVTDINVLKNALFTLLDGTDLVDGAFELYLDTFEKMNALEAFDDKTHGINYLLAAFVGIDFINNQANQYLGSSYLYSILDSLKDKIVNEMNHKDIDFINPNNSVDNDKLYNLLVLYNYPLATDGYGIYALASSKGILNGNFIPDNMNLAAMDPYYNKSAGYYQISDVTDSIWRGGDDEGTPIKTDTSSVNYAFYVSMKQLKLSIATTVFDIRLVSTDTETTNYLLTQEEFIQLKAPEEFEGIADGIITFYVNSNYPIGVLTDKYRVDMSSGNYLLSYNAVFADDTSSKTIGVGEEMIIRVFAEDRTVYYDYLVRIVNNGELGISVSKANVDGTDSSFTNNNSNGSTITSAIPPTGGSMVIQLSTTGLEPKTNLLPYLSLGSLNIADYFVFNQEPIVQLDGTVILDFTVRPTLSKGIKELSIVLPSLDSSEKYTYKIAFDKEESSDNTLESITFDGTTYTFNGNIATSYILAGRVFNYDDFMVHASNKPNYISEIVGSETATIQTQVTLLDADAYESNRSEVIMALSSSITSRICYKITYRVTAENGNNREYYHYIIEQKPFDSYESNYATVYKNGEIDADTLISSSDGTIKSSFTRGYKPNYRFSYLLSSFYAYDSIINHLMVQSDTSDLVDGQSIFSSETRYYGFNVNFFDAAEPGEYRFNLVYSSYSANWNGSTFQRVIATPEVVITKLASTDAYLKKITFIDSASKISNLATVGYLSTIYPSGTKEPLYQTLSSIANSENNTNPIISSNDGLTYTEEAMNADTYYMVGTVSNATLEEYSPTFVIEEHAQIYQFKSINGIRKIYVPFEDAQGNITIFLVDEEFITNPSAIVKAYNVDYTGVEVGYTISSNTFRVDGTTYSLSDYAGSTNGRNISLYMDYIGVPEEDEFWYVSYIIYAENPDYHKVYNIAILDLTNTILFELDIVDNSSTKLPIDSSLYVTIVSYKTSGTGTTNDPYKKTTEVAYTMSVFSYYNAETNTYVLPYSLQKLPFGFFEFYIDLPDGYTANYTITTEKKENTNTDPTDLYAYLPPTSIVTQRIAIQLEIAEDTQNSYPWGEKLTDNHGIHIMHK